MLGTWMFNPATSTATRCPDLAIINVDGNSVTVLLGTGSGGFAREAADAVEVAERDRVGRARQ
jgi:hypothetical protein